MNHVLLLFKYFSLIEYFFLYKYSETAISGNLEALKVKHFSRLAPTMVAPREIRPRLILETFLRPWIIVKPHD